LPVPPNANQLPDMAHQGDMCRPAPRDTAAHPGVRDTLRSVALAAQSTIERAIVVAQPVTSSRRKADPNLMVLLLTSVSLRSRRIPEVPTEWPSLAFLGRIRNSVPLVSHRWAPAT